MARHRTKKLDTFYGLNFNSPIVTGNSYGYQESSDMMNVKLSRGQGFDCKPGRANLGSVAEIIHSLDFYNDYADNESLLIGAGSKIYKDASGAGSPVVSLTGLTDGAKSSCCTFLDYFWHVNGTDENKKFDGTSWTKMVLSAPAAGPTVADGGAGSLSGDYQYCAVYVEKNTLLGYESESRRSDISKISVTSKQITVSVTAESTGQATYIRVYRRSSDGADWRRVPLGPGANPEDLPNTTASYTDNYEEDDLETDIEYENEGEPLDTTADLNPVTLEGIVEWSGRLWGWAGSWLYMTRQGRPGDWWNAASTEQQPIYCGPGRITAVKPTPGNYLAVWADRMILISGVEPFAFEEFSDDDCLGQRAAARASKALMWVSSDGVKKWNGNSAFTVPVGDPIDYDSAGLNRGVLDNSDNTVRNSCCAYLRGEKQLWLSTPQNSSRRNKQTFVYNFRLPLIWREAPTEETPGIEISRWARIDNAFAAIAVSKDNRVVTADGTSGDYTEELTGTTDFGVAIDGYRITRRFDHNDQFRDVRVYDLVASAEGGSAQVTLTAMTEVKQIDQVITEVFPLSPSGDTWSDTGDTWSDTGDYWQGVTSQKLNTTVSPDLTGDNLGWRVDLSGGQHFCGLQYSWEYSMRAMD